MPLLAGQVTAGWTSDCLHADCALKLPAKVGPDGRGGEQPCGAFIAGNLFREFGIWQKQSSALFMALSALFTFESNVVFNGPRAAINCKFDSMVCVCARLTLSLCVSGSLTLCVSLPQLMTRSAEATKS